MKRFAPRTSSWSRTFVPWGLRCTTSVTATGRAGRRRRCWRRPGLPIPCKEQRPPSHRRYALDLDQEVRVEQALDHDQGAGRQLPLEHLAACLGHGREVLDPGDIGGDLHEVVEVTTRRPE